MVREYQQKNPYFKNSRLTIKQSEQLVLMYLKGVKASQCAKFLGSTHVSVGRHYKEIDKIINTQLLFWDFTRFLDDKDEDDLKNMVYVIRGIVANLGRKPEPATEEWDIAWREEQPLLAFVYGDGDYYPTLHNLASCINTCDSETPPLVVRKLINDGRVQELRDKRIKCRTCPLRFKNLYVPRNSAVFYAKECDEKKYIYEPNIEYKGDVNDMIVFWVDILWFMSHLRKHDGFNYAQKVMHAAYYAALKRGEYKVKDLITAGTEVPTPLLYPEQIEKQKRGIRYLSTLDLPMTQFVLEILKKK